METKFDVVVVGAGPAGASAAYTAARHGLKVLLVERGRGAGSKQVFGGRVYAAPLREIYEDFDKEAPIHRWVRKERVSLVHGDRMVTFEYESDRTVSFTTYLTQLTSWMVEKAVDAGAIFVDEVRVDSILRNDAGKVVGVESGSERVYADIVVDAEGVNRLLLEKLGLVEKTRPSQVALGVKEVVKVGEDKINERFGVAPGEGVSWVLTGDVSGNMPGGAFIYTNKDTVSIGVVVYLESAVNMVKEPIHILVEKLRTHPSLKRLWADGDVMEYAARLTPESGYRYMPRKLATHGLMVAGDAAGLLLNTGYTFRGVDYAALSGYMAGNAAVKALEEGDTGEENLRRLYEKPLLESFIVRDLKRHRGIEWLMSNPEFFKKYPALATGVACRLFDLEDEAPTVYEALRSSASDQGLSLLRLVLDMFRVVRKL